MPQEIFNPGAMRFPVELQKPTIARNPDGSEPKDFTAASPVFAAIDFGEGREFFAAKSVYADMTHMLTIYSYAGLDSTWRVKFVDGDQVRYLDIRGVKPSGTM